MGGATGLPLTLCCCVWSAAGPKPHKGGVAKGTAVVSGPSGNSNRKIRSQILVCKEAGLKRQHDACCVTRRGLEHLVTGELCLLVT